MSLYLRKGNCVNYRQKLEQIFMYTDNTVEAKDIKKRMLEQLRTEFVELRREGIPLEEVHNMVNSKLDNFRDHYPETNNLMWIDFHETTPYKRLLYRNFIIFFVLSIPVYIFLPALSIFLHIWIGFNSRSIIRKVDENTHFWLKRRLLPKLYMGLLTYMSLALFLRYNWTLEGGMYALLILYVFMIIMVGFVYLVYRPGMDYIPKRNIILAILDGPSPRSKTSAYLMMYLMATISIYVIVFIMIGLESIVNTW